MEASRNSNSKTNNDAGSKDAVRKGVVLMKWLILSCNTGEGHNSAAHAVMEAAEHRGIECELRDPVSFSTAFATKAASSTYNGMIRKIPTAFGVVYKAGELLDKTNLTSPIYVANSIYAKSLTDYLEREKINAVICTHLYGMEAMTAVRKTKNNMTPCFGVVTDYTYVPFLSETEMDLFFIPHEDLTEEFEEKGMDPKKLIPTGIPVSSKFCYPIGRKAARNTLIIPEIRRVYLVMSGGMGSGALQSIGDLFLKKEKGDFMVYIMVGRNGDLGDKLRERYKSNPRVQIVTYTSKVHLFMQAADVVVSKPGGLSSTEAIVLGVPLIHLLHIPGCETKNAAFFEEHGMSIKADSPADAVSKAKDLIHDHEMKRKMFFNRYQHVHPDAAETIVDRILKVIG